MSLTRTKAILRRLRGNLSGLAAVEFALSLPLLLTAGLYGTETANMALTYMRVHKVAMHIADNAARIGDTSTITNRAIFEADVSDLLVGGNTQAGTSLEFYERGRAIVSSLEVYNPAVSCGGKNCPGSQTDGVNFIHWQRCMGKKNYNSSYGDEYDEMALGMGPTGKEVMADAGGAVIFVEVAYDYRPLISRHFVGAPTITAISSFTQRDNIDLSGLKKIKRRAGEFFALCNKYTSGPA